MSFVRLSRFGPRGNGRKVLKAKKKKTPVKQEWDSTVSDLTVHRATPEDLVRRHELHKSKNRALAHWELQEKALKRKWKKQKQDTPDLLGKRRLAIMKEILSDNYQMQDALERSDEMMAVAKDLFGDAPRRRTGYPNVTIAPDSEIGSSPGPIVSKRDPLTESILTESSIDPQALNEVEEGEGEETINSQSEESENELDSSLNFQSNTRTDRLLQRLNEENSEFISKLCTSMRQKIATSQKITPPSTPTVAIPSLEHRALNATNAVKRIQSRLPPEEPTGNEDSNYVVGQVLNPNSRKQKQQLAKVKKKSDLSVPTKAKKNVSFNNITTSDTSRGDGSSLDVLKHMIHEVEHEMEEYERWTGREVKGWKNSQGLTGFTLSLVSSLCRLVRYLKESEMQLRKEVDTRQRLEVVLGDHRELIDALTAEILLLREENTALQAKLQQYMLTTDEQLISLTHAIKSIPVIGPNREESPSSERGVAIRSIANSQEAPVVNDNASVPLMFRREMTEFPQEELPVKLTQLPNSTDGVGLANTLPAHMFEPAVMLTPPRQKNNAEFLPLQEALRRTVQTRPAPRFLPSVEITEKEQNWEKKNSPNPVEIPNSNEENRLFTQRWRVSHMDEDLENKTQPLFASVPPTQCPPPHFQHLGNHTFPEEPPVLGDGQQLKTDQPFLQSKDLMARIAELTLQNTAIKAHLNSFIGPSGEQGDGPQDPAKLENENDMTATFPAVQPQTPNSMEERIAELNRQSVEARGKLLQLIEQQKLVGLNTSSQSSPPGHSPLRAWTEGGKRTIEMSVPGAETTENLNGSAVSSASGMNARRSSGATSNSCSPLNTTSGSGRFTPLNQRAKVEKQREGGWFALSTHVT
ncbi:spindle and centriole-associated protein 1 [Gracilinanus agilis]|uniref:spindle and centriole-associated protein 1 n=1 Tax=Gracilinanus agilis TaxID=191870 RepID=UPI001CFE4697|nr:spindle and centriole-associated protein 1 [Gracilinanus agilis]